MTPVQGTRLGPYELRSLLGAGGMGQVYRARDSRLNRDVAVKVLPESCSRDAEKLRRFEQEARAAGALNHPNIVAVYDFGEHDGSPYLVTELLEGETLRARMSGALPRRKILDWAQQIARGLWAAHQRGIVHRDLKPENIFVTADGMVKILDFGLAKLASPPPGAEEGSTLSMHSQPGMVLGTIGYMSPEQVRGQSAEQQSDIFSFGAILYEMLAGRRAFDGQTPVETMHAILKDEPPPLADAALDRLVRHALEKAAGERFQSVRDLAFALESFSGASQPEPQARSRAHSRRRLAILALAIPAALAGGYFIARARPEAAPSPIFHQLTFRAGAVTTARFSPDGRTIVYSAAWDGQPAAFYLARTDSPESRPLGLPSGGVLALSRNDELAMTVGCEFNWGDCQGTLARVPLAGGAPRETLENVYFADWSPDGNALAVVRPVEGRYRLEYPIGTVLYETAGWITHPRFSPKGDLIAFVDRPRLGDPTGTVAVVDRKGVKKTLTHEAHTLSGLAWRPSGDEIWYAGGTDPSNSWAGLYAVTLSGRQRLVLPVPGDLVLADISADGRVLLLDGTVHSRLIFSSGAGESRDLSWFHWSTGMDISADGKTLLFDERGTGTARVPVVYLRRTDGSDAIRLGEGKALSLSPNGKYALAIQGVSPQRLVLLPTGAGEPKTLAPGAAVEYYAAAWFPDGERIFFVAEGKDHLPQSYIQRIDGGDPQIAAPDGMLAVLVSPDGGRLAAQGPEGAFYICPVSGGTPESIRGAEPGDTLIQWSADGRALFVRAPGEEAIRIFRIDLASGRRSLWREMALPDRVGSIGTTADQRAVRITPDGKYCVYTYWTALNELYWVDGLK